MSKKTIVKLAVATILIVSGTVLQNEALKEIGNHLIK